MSVIKEYNIIKDVLNDKSVESEILERSISLIVSIMEDWLDTYNYSKDFESLMYAIKDDYLYDGIAYRGITLLKDNKDLIDKIEFLGVQSFSKSKEVAVNFATNNMVTIGEEINILKNPEEVDYVIIEYNGNSIGIDLHKFSNDLIYICRSFISNKELVFESEETLGYAVDEKEVLVYPNTLINNKEFISIYNLNRNNTKI